MSYIRQATLSDAERVAEMLIFNYRSNFYPIFRDDRFYFETLTVSRLAPQFARDLAHIWVYDDGVVKGFIQIEGQEVKKLFVEPVLQGNSIGAELLAYAVTAKNADTLWVLEKNKKAISFYTRHGFALTKDKKYEEDTTELLVRMAR